MRCYNLKNRHYKPKTAKTAKPARDGAVRLKTANPQKPQKNRKTETANRGAVRFLFLKKPQVRLRFGFSQKPHQTAPCSPLVPILSALCRQGHMLDILDRENSQKGLKYKCVTPFWSTFILFLKRVMLYCYIALPT